MLSGGRDSVCLLDVAVALRGAGSVRALHVNYGLRGEESDADERHCAALCEALGVEFEIVRVGEDEGGGNLQAWARELRYGGGDRAGGAAGRAARAGGRPVHTTYGCCRCARALVAAWHTATDQVETILSRLRPRRGAARCLGCGPSKVGSSGCCWGWTRAQTGQIPSKRGGRAGARMR